MRDGGIEIVDVFCLIVFDLVCNQMDVPMFVIVFQTVASRGQFFGWHRHNGDYLGDQGRTNKERCS